MYSKLLKIILPAAFALMSVSAQALTVNSAAGSLGNSIADVNVGSLTVTGQLNAADFQFITDNLKKLTELDLSAAKIVAYNGERVLTGGTAYGENILPAYSLAGASITSLKLPSTLTAIEEGALSASAVTTLEIPASVTSIGNYAFAGCTSLRSIALPAAADELGEGVFSGCTALVNASLTSKLTAVPSSTFAGCTALNAVVLPAATTSIGDSAFKGTAALKSLSFPSSLKQIGENAFYGSGITEANFSACKSLADVGDFAFAKCSGLKSVSLSDNPSLGRGVFFDDVALTNFTLPASVTVIPELTFKGASSLDPKEVVHDDITEIKDYALTGWGSAKELRLPGNLSHIGTGAMEGWAALDTINASALHIVPSLGDDVWAEVDQPNVILYVEKSRVNDFKGADQWNRFNIITDDTTGIGETITAAPAGIEYSIEGTTLLITSLESPIVDVEIYDLAGSRKYSRKDSAQSVRVNTEAWKNSVVVVCVTLANGSRSAVKMVF